MPLFGSDGDAELAAGGHAPVAVLLPPPGHGVVAAEGEETVLFDLEELSWMESVVGVVFCA